MGVVFKKADIKGEVMERREWQQLMLVIGYMSHDRDIMYTCISCD